MKPEMPLFIYSTIDYGRELTLMGPIVIMGLATPIAG